MRRRRSPTRYPLRSTRSGFTLAEVVVALLLLACGALALVAASASAVSAVSGAEARTRAVAAARDRVERLAASPCARLRDGAALDPARGIRERWIVGPARNGARILTDSAAYVDRGVTRHAVVHRVVVC